MSARKTYRCARCARQAARGLLRRGRYSVRHGGRLCPTCADPKAWKPATTGDRPGVVTAQSFLFGGLALSETSRPASETRGPRRPMSGAEVDTYIEHLYPPLAPAADEAEAYRRNAVLDHVATPGQAALIAALTTD